MLSAMSLPSPQTRQRKKKKNACGQGWKTQSIVVALTSIISSMHRPLKVSQVYIRFPVLQIAHVSSSICKDHHACTASPTTQEFPFKGSFLSQYLRTVHQWLARDSALKIEYVFAAVSSARWWHHNCKSWGCEQAKHILKALPNHVIFENIQKNHVIIQQEPYNKPLQTPLKPS